MRWTHLKESGYDIHHQYQATMFVLLVQVYCFQSSIFNNLSKRGACIISNTEALPSNLDVLLSYIVSPCIMIQCNSNYTIPGWFQKYIAFLN